MVGGAGEGQAHGWEAPLTPISFEFVGWLLAGPALFWSLPPRWRSSSLAGTGLALLIRLDVTAALYTLGLVGVAVALTRKGISGWVAALAVLMSVGMFAGLRLSRMEEGVATSLPLGLAYAVPRFIQVMIEGWRQPRRVSFPDLMAYFLFAPALVAGPVHSLEPFERNLRRIRWDGQQFSLGCTRVLYGYVRMVLLADTLVPWLFQHWRWFFGHVYPWLDEWMAAAEYGADLYLTFSGYSEVAVGAALLFGITLPENFDRPFLAHNLPTFWRSWHSSLSGWCRSFVYEPVAALSRSAAVGVMFSMGVLALWHEFSGRYVLWGVWHGLGLVVWQGWQRLRPRLGPPLSPAWEKRTRVLSVILTQLFVVAGFSITRAPDLPSALAGLRTLLGGG